MKPTREDLFVRGATRGVCGPGRSAPHSALDFRPCIAPETEIEQRGACLHVLEERCEKRPVALLLVGDPAVGVPQEELGMQRHLQRV